MTRFIRKVTQEIHKRSNDAIEHLFKIDASNAKKVMQPCKLNTKQLFRNAVLPRYKQRIYSRW